MKQNNYGRGRKAEIVSLPITPSLNTLDVAKRAGRVGSIGFAGQTGHGSKRVILNGSIRLRVNQVLSRVGSGQVYPYFSKFFFFQLQKQINDNLFRENE